MSRRSISRCRAVTITELMVTLVIAGLILTFVGAIFAPLLNSPFKQQAKVDTVQASVRALYRMQRDIRMSATTGIYMCQNNATAPNCATPAATLADAPVVAIITALPNGNGYFQYDTSGTGQAKWTGYQVYWVDSNNQLKYAFGSASGLGTGDNSGLIAASADTAVSNALAATPETIAQNISDIQLSLNLSQSVKSIGLKLFTIATDNNRTNKASLESDTVSRN